MNDLDGKVIAAIRGGANTNQAIQKFVLGKKAEGGYDHAIDVALQRLRREGTAIYDRKNGWHIAASKPCEACRGSGRVPL